GSTGRPKGAMNEHRAVVNRLLWMQEQYQLGEDDRVLQKTPFSFDVSVWELFWPLMSGARLVVARPGGHQDPAYLMELIEQSGITTLHFVPSMLQAFLGQHEMGRCRSIRHIVCSGEELPLALQNKCLERLPRARLSNLYGPTECAVDVTAWECEKDETGSRVPIGRPIANTRMYVLDRHGQPAPIEVAGEIYIAGMQVGRGYLNRPQLTAERFLADPFSSEPGARMYKTGDVGRWRADGAIEYLGRSDEQVKIRGFRIELGEIEAQLVRHEGVKEAVVLAREDEPGEKRLVAYVVAQEGLAVEAAELRGHLRRSLPEYMIPGAFVQLQQLPLTVNGKVDRKGLPAPEGRGQSGQYVAPRTATEQVLAQVWAEVLHLERVGIHDSFFELGGHSLLATQVIARVREVLQVDVPLRTLLDDTTTVAELAIHLEDLRREGQELTLPPLVLQMRAGRIPLSYAQERLWFLEQLGQLGAAYNVPAALYLEGQLDVPALERSFEELGSRHEMLRMQFRVSEGAVYQEAVQPGQLRIEVTDYSSLEEQEAQAAAERYAEGQAVRPFDLLGGSPVRVCLVRINPQKHLLVVIMHHIITDGWSAGVMIRELSALYEAQRSGREARLSQLALQYADYALWQRSWLQGEVLGRQLGYWKEQLAGAPAMLQLPTDHPRPT